MWLSKTVSIKGTVHSKCLALRYRAMSPKLFLVAPGYRVSLIFRHAKQAKKPLERVQAVSTPQMKARLFLGILTESHMDDW